MADFGKMLRRSDECDDFDTIIERRHTQSFKWDLAETLVGEKDVLPLWVADMDFNARWLVVEAIQRRLTWDLWLYCHA